MANFLPQPQNASSYLAPFIGKRNYLNLPPQPQLNQDQTLLSPCMVDVSCLGQTSFRTITRFTTAASTGALVLDAFFTQWNNATPTSPVLVRTGTGVYTITYPTLVSHEYTASLQPPITNNITVNMTSAFASVSVYAVGVSFVAATVSGNVITVKLFNTSFAAVDNVGTIIVVGAL